MSTAVVTVKDIGRAIRNERKKQKILQQDLSDLCGVSSHFLSNLENGKENVDMKKVLQVLNILGLELIIISRVDKQDRIKWA